VLGIFCASLWILHLRQCGDKQVTGFVSESGSSVKMKLPIMLFKDQITILSPHKCTELNTILTVASKAACCGTDAE